MNRQQINNNGFLSFYDYLVGQSQPGKSGIALSDDRLIESLTGERKDSNNSENYLMRFSDYQTSLYNLTSEVKVLSAFNLLLQGVILVKDFSLLVFDENSSDLIPMVEKMTSRINDAINHYYKEGILSLVLDRNKAAIIPVLNSYNTNGSKQYFYIIPIVEDRKTKGLFVIFTPDPQETITADKKHFIERALIPTVSRIEYIQTRRKLNDTYNELLTYQAKLANDFKLTAVGELTIGIAEEIISPLQVITTQLDLFEDESVSKEDLNIMKSQIGKINNAVNRLIKFSSSSNNDLKISPVSLNEYIIDFYNLTRSSWESIKIECVLDLDKEVPPVLSHQNYIYQILSNVFEAIKSEANGTEGVIIQTRYKQDNIIIKIISTVNLTTFEKKNLKGSGSKSMNYKILENLMKKHEGKLDLIASETSGSTLSLLFPIKRKIR
jgi:signal transduction histidine kinase